MSYAITFVDDNAPLNLSFSN